jgi:hypothetical protein
MEDLDLFVFLPSLVSALVVGGIAYYFFKTHTDYLNNQKQLELKLESRKVTLPMKIQAYERLTLFCERMALVNILNRIKPISNEKEAYENLLISHIEQEYEHNLVQQLYVSDECWGVVKTAKISIINRIRKTNMSSQINDAYKLRETLLLDLFEQKNDPSQVALQVLKKEMRRLL